MQKKPTRLTKKHLIKGKHEGRKHATSLAYVDKPYRLTVHYRQ